MGDRTGPRVFVSAGEPSGDLHGAHLVTALRERWPDATIAAFGGPRMEAAGATILRRMETFTALGLVEVVHKIPRHIRLLRELRAAFRRGDFDLVVLIDYPGFHLRLAEAARGAGLPVLYYIAPQLWAWRPERAARLGRAVKGLAVILPFEEAFFARAGIAAEFVGHPLVEARRPSREEARAALGIGADERVLALFPGSREGEVARLREPLNATAHLLRTQGRVDRVVVANALSMDAGLVDGALIHRGDSGLVLAAADAVVAKSGTTTLEAALADVPMVVVYRVHPITAWLARRMLRVSSIGLVNLVAGERIVPELVQEELTPATLAAALSPLLEPGSAASIRQREGLRRVRDALGRPGAAKRVVDMAERLLGG